MTGDDAKGRQEVSDRSNDPQRVDKREKISKFLEDRKEKNMVSKKSFESKQLSLMREVVSLKRNLLSKLNQWTKNFCNMQRK